jgi:hypothetical protein
MFNAMGLLNDLRGRSDSNGSAGTQPVAHVPQQHQQQQQSYCCCSCQLEATAWARK